MLSRDNSREAAGSEESVGSTGPQAPSPMLAEWADEKHNLYLSSMESSFLDRFFNSNGASADVLGCLQFASPKSANNLGSSSNCIFSCQLQFLRLGRCETHTSGGKRALLEMKDETRHSFENPWVKHFTARSRALNQIDSNELHTNRRMQYYERSTSQNQEQTSGSRMRNHYPTGSTAEASDQNFVGVDSGEENQSRMLRRKRVKTEHIQSPAKDGPAQDDPTKIVCSSSPLY